MKYINVEPNVKIAVHDLNECGTKTIVFLHGWPMSSRIFEYQMNILPYYDYRVVAIDFRGFGESDVTSDGYSYDGLATDVYKVVKALDLKDFILVGFSLGGAIAIRYMTLFQGYCVKKLALLAAAAPSIVKQKDFPYGSTLGEQNAQIELTYRDRPKMVYEFSERIFYLPHSEEVKEWFRFVCYEASGIGTIQSAIYIRDADLRGELEQIKVKTGIFHGEKDMVCPYEFALYQHDKIKNSVLYSFKNSGHAVFYDELMEFNDKFIRFIEGV